MEGSGVLHAAALHCDLIGAGRSASSAETAWCYSITTENGGTTCNRIAKSKGTKVLV